MKKHLAMIVALVGLCAILISAGYWDMMEREAGSDAELAGKAAN